jgi:sirohydrochlorin cobaltochelatase
MDTIPVIAVAFGTSTEARDTYVFFEEQLMKRYPAIELAWAFTSRILREKAHKTDREMKSLEAVLQNYEQRGYKRAVVQSLHIIPGFEFQKITEAARRTTLQTAIGMPLLTSDEDIEKTVSALADSIPPPEECATVLVGHGTHHPAGKAYRKIERILQKRYQEHVLISVVEGEPPWKDARETIQKSGVNKVKFIPLMFVAGDHMLNEVMGEDSEDGEASWKMQLQGIEVDASEKGLGFNKKIINIYLQHLEEAHSYIS